MRGKVACADQTIQPDGIYPRMGGEKIIWASVSIAALGLPPRRRGKVVGHSGVLLDVGITPAWAGKRCDIKNVVRKARDHPRMGGEKAVCPVTC